MAPSRQPNLAARSASTPTPRARVSAVLLASTLLAIPSCAPRSDFDPSARAQFSSKARSMESNASNVATATPDGTGTPTAGAPTSALASDGASGGTGKPPTTDRPIEIAAGTGTPTSTSADQTGTPIPVVASTTPSNTQVPAPSTILQPPSHAADAEEATRILHAAATSKWPALRAHAIEASIRSPEMLRELAPTALADENRGVRFVACMAIAEARLTDLDPALLERVTALLADPSPSVHAAAMLALSRSGRPVNFTPLADMLSNNDPEVRANAYLVLGELGNESAVPLIRESLGKGMKLVNPIRVRLVELAAAEALVKLGDQEDVEPIRAALFAPAEQGELTVVACDSVGRLRDEVARPMLERLLVAGGNAERSPEIRLAAARALAKLGSSKAPLMIGREYAAHPDARVRAQSAALLGEIGSSEANALLATLLHDQNPTVQIAAAGGIEAGD